MAGSRFAAGAAGRSQPERSLHILLADGDKNARHSISRLLHDRGHSVTEVPDGQVAVELLSSQHIDGPKVDVVFADVQTAVANGPDFLRKFYDVKEFRSTPVVVMSSEESSRDLVIQCLDAGACECLSKPVRPNDLATLLEHVRQRISGSNGQIGVPGEGAAAVGSLSSGEAAGNSGSNKDPASGGAMEGVNGSGNAGSRGERSGSGEEDGGRPNRGNRPGSGGDASGAGSGAGGGSGGGSGSNGSGGGTDGSGSNGRGEEQSSAGSRSLRPPAALHLPLGGPSSNYHSSEGASDTSSRAHFANNLKVKGVLDPPPFSNLASTTPPSAAAEKQGSEGEEDEIGGSGGEGSPDTDEQDRENDQRGDEDEVMEEVDEREPQRSQMPTGGNRVLPRGLLELAHLGNCREQEAHALAVQQQKSYHAVVEDEAAARHQKMIATQNAPRGSLKHSNSCSAFSAFGVPGDMEEAAYYNRFQHELAGHPHGPHGRPLHPGSHPYSHPRPPHMDGHPPHYGHHPVHQAPPPHYAHHPPPYPYSMVHPMMHAWGGMGLGGMPRMPHGMTPGAMNSHMSNYYNQAAMQMGNALRSAPPPHGHSHPSTPTMGAASMNYSSPGQHSQLSPSPSASGASGADQHKANVQQGQLSVHGYTNTQARRQAALAKFREKRKNRNFDRKVRYESRKRLAEERPRIRGQFVKRSELSATDGGSNSSNTASNTAVAMGDSKSPPALEEATATV